MFTNSSNNKDNIMGGFGNMNWAAARIDQIRFTFLEDNLKIGLLSPNTATSIPNPIGPSFSGSSDTTLPTIEVAYTLNVKPVKLIFAGGYASYDVVDGDDSETIASNFFGLAAFVNFGSINLIAEAHMAKNGGNYGLNYGGLSFAEAAWDPVDEDVIDNDSLGYQIVVNFQATEDVIVEAGYGYLGAEPDVSGADKDEATMVYINCPINLAGGVLITPEIGQIDYKDDVFGNAEGKETFYGAVWKISF
jgi:hypothetical protein